MNKEFVPYETAVKLKELGFCTKNALMWWIKYPGHEPYLVDENVRHERIVNELDNIGILAPLWQQAFEWLREKHNFMYHVEDIKVSAGNTEGYRFRYFAWKLMSVDFIVENKSLLGYLTYEQAREKCLAEMINYIKDESERT